MPSRPKRPCSHFGCPNLVEGGGRCPEHKQQNDKQRGSSTKRGYNYRWQQARETFLKQHPLCVQCEAEGRIAPAIIVDHIIPHKGNQTLFWDTGNWQPLCKTHHDIKTAKEDGGFGNG